MNSMKTIKGRVISVLQKGKVAEIQTGLGIYGINRVVRSFTDFRSPLSRRYRLARPRTQGSQP